jgi:branched-chain amino acid transport system substrate-binding protein
VDQLHRRPALRRGFIALALLCSALILPGCPNSSGPSGGGGSAEILVGHYASLTGPQATFGQSTDNGVKMAIEEFNAAGGLNGKKVRLITYDDKGDTKEVGTAVTRLVTSDQVTAVIGQVASSLSLAGGPICQENGVPMISPSSTNPKVTQIGDMVFRVCFIDPFQGSVCARFAKDSEKLKTEKAAILYDQSQAYSVGLMDEFEKAYTALGGKIVSKQSFQDADQDFSAQLTQIRSANPEVVFIPVYYSKIGNIAQQARKLDLTVPFIGADGWESGDLPELAGHSLDGSFYSNHYSQESDSPKVKEFLAKYKSKYGGTADSMAALGYDAANVLFEAMKKSPSLGGKDLAAAIAQTKDFEGVTGKITLNAERNAVKPAVIMEIKDGKPTFLTTVDP